MNLKHFISTKILQETPVRYPSLDDESNSSIKVVLDPNSAETKNKLAWENTQVTIDILFY